MDTIGNRIAFCRKLLNLSQIKFSQVFNISKSTITRWELDSVAISQNRLKQLIEEFAVNGLVVDLNWLISGIGDFPISDTALSIEQINFDEISLKHLQEIKSKIKNFEIHQVNSKFFEPIINYGDYVGCVLSELTDELNNRLCLIQVKKNVVIGIIDTNKKVIKNIFGKSKNIENRSLISEVLFISKRFSS